MLQVSSHLTHPTSAFPPSTSLSAPPTQSNNPAHSPTITTESTSRYRVEQHDMPDGSADRHASPVEPEPANTINTEAVLKLEHQLKTSLDAQKHLQNELNSAHDFQQQLQNELETLRENYTSSLEQVKSQVSSSYQIQLTNLQQSLMQTEGQLHNLEHRLSEVNEKHHVEMENLLQTQENIRETIMKEKDLKHAEHIARITTELTNQSAVSGVGSDRESDDWEAERLKLIKEKMKELHEKEKEELLSEHEQDKKKLLSNHEAEKTQLHEELQQKMETNRVQMEQLANSKIQEVHAQFMAAHQAVVEQKNTAETNAAQMLNQIQEVQSQLDALKREKESVEYQYRSLLETHMSELESARRDSLSLEQRLNNWKEKAANLENRLESTKSETSVEINEVRQQHEEDLDRMKSDYEQKLQTLQQVVDDYQTKFQVTETDNQRTLEELKSQHEFDIDELRSSHASEVSLLEENASESSGNKASLEVAEEHMQSLQKQLDDYRTQERNFESRLSELRREHAEDLQQVRQTLEAQKVEEIEGISAEFKSQIKGLEEDVGRLSTSVESGQSAEVIGALKMKHQSELLELQNQLRTNHEEFVKNLREELENSHTHEVESLQQEHTTMLNDLRKELEREWSTKMDREKSMLTSELAEARHVEIERLKSEHKQTLDKQRAVLAKSEQTTFTKAQEQVKDIEAEMDTLRDELSQKETVRKDLLSQLELSERQLHKSQESLTRTNTEISQLSGDCTTYQNRVKSLEVELSIAGSAHEQDVQTVTAMKQEVETYRLKLGELESELTGLQEVQSSLSEQSQEASHLKDQLAQKNVSIAELQAQNDSLNTEVYSLTQKCHKCIASSEVLQKQLENSWGANEEIESLKQHLSELKPFKERCELLQERVGSLEAAFRVKEDEMKELKSQTTAKVHEANEYAMRQEEAAISSNEKVEELTKETAVQNEQQAELRQTIESLNKSVIDVETKLGSMTDEVAQLVLDKEQLQQNLTDAQNVVDEETLKKYEDLVADFHSVSAEKEQLAQEIEELRNKQESLLDEQRTPLEEKIQEQQKLIREMEAKMSVKEPTVAEHQIELGHQLTESESCKSSLSQTVQDSKATQEQLGVVLKEKSGLEENLSRARRALTDKLHDKTVLEKELSFHRAELERRLSEKQRLEEVLFEKSRFEQELVSQKEQLLNELTEIESKLQLKDVEHEHERGEWLKKIHQKDDEMTQLTSDLNHRHDLHVSSIVEEHKRKVTGVEQSLRKTHGKDMQSLMTRHRKEVN